MTDSRPDRWQLPDGVDELLPETAWRVESLRRDFVDRCRAWGFELVMPPLIEYVESLLTGSGEMLDLQTFKLVDQHNGRTLGVRADMTPQVARIDAHALAGDGPNRLFYTGTVLRARADGVGGSRSPQQFGAELFGHGGLESDVEICRLMLETVDLAGVATETVLLDLGHVGVYRTLAADARLAAEDEAGVFEALQRGSAPDLHARLDALSGEVDDEALGRLAALVTLRGDARVLERARETLEGASAGVGRAIDALERLVAALGATHPEVGVHVDLAELRGYAYHSGALFAVHDASGARLAHGGRYDAVGEAFGRARPATGFSGDLVQLAERGAAARPAAPTRGGAIRVAEPDLVDAWRTVRALRANGERVLSVPPGNAAGAERCDRELVRGDEGWTVRPIASV